MKKLLTALLLMFTTVFAALAQPGHLVISQVYGAGGNSGAPFTHDFVELFNPTDKAVSLEGWSLQYATATDDGSKWGAYTALLSGTIEPGKYFLIQFNGGANGKPLPTPDLVRVIGNGLSATDGKLALVNSTSPLTGRCPVSGTVVDFVGYGKGDCFETAAAPATATAKGIIRKDNGCTDNDDNAADFFTAAPSPRNSTAPANVCNGGSVQVRAVSASVFCITPAAGANGSVAFEAAGQFSDAVFNVVLSDANGSFTNSKIIGGATVSGTNPAGNIAIYIPEGLPGSNAYRTRIDVVKPSLTGQPSNAIEVINGAANITTLAVVANADKATINWTNPAGCFNEIMVVVKEGASVNELPTGDGTTYAADLNVSGSGTPFNGGKVVYKGSQPGIIITGLQTGKEYFIKALTRNAIYWSSGIEVKAITKQLPQPGEILINQVSPEYADPSDEYIELVNTTGKTFDLSELNISYHAASGNTGTVGKRLSGILQPHSYWLLSNTETVTVGKTSLARDGDFTGRYAATAGQLALVRLVDNVVIDAFGYGKIDLATYTETQPAPAPLAKGGYRRKTEGWDTNNNSTDFERVANADIELRNSKSRLALKDATINAGVYTRLYVTGNAALSGDVTLTEKAVLQNGLLMLSDNQLTTPKTEGGSAVSYYQTNGNGAVRVQLITETATLVPVGNSTYNPVTIANGGGVDWQVRVVDEVLPATTPFDAKKAVLRTWIIKPLATLSNGAAIQLFYNLNAQQTGADFTDADVQVWHYGAQWLMAGEVQKQVKGNGASAITVSKWKSAGNFVIANALAEMSSLTVLPIRFINVKATEQPHAVQIEFTNATETDVAHYLIERSSNGIDFSPIATLNPLHNNGGAAAYTWLDKTRPAGNNYYRIKGVEMDGKQMYSAVLKVVINKDLKALMVFPNPVQGRQLTWQASLPQGAFVLRILGSNGQQVVNKKFEHRGGNLSQVIELPASIRPGVYNLQISNGQFEQWLMFVVL